MESYALRIAVADDESDIRQFLTKLLTRLGHQVVAVAEDGQQLVEQCRQTCPDLVLTDVTMPILSGLDAVAEINQEREVPAVLMSAYTEDELFAPSQDIPPYILACLTKPVRASEIQTVLARPMQTHSLSEATSHFNQ